MSAPAAPGDGRASTFGPRPRSGSDGNPPTLGIIGLALIGLDIVVVLIATYLAVPSGYVVASASFEMAEPMRDSVWRFVNLWLVLRVVGIIALGLVGWVIGIVATVTNRGRSYGIAAIVLGALLCVIAAFMTLGALLIVSVG